MAKYKIIFDRENCIGAGSCVAIAEKFWKLMKDGKADLLGSTLNEETGHYELIVDEDDLRLAEESAEVCPVAVIRVEKVED